MTDGSSHIDIKGYYDPAGGHFAVACEDANGSALHAEVEQLMLAPGAWLADSLGLFGLVVEGVQVNVLKQQCKGPGPMTHNPTLRLSQ